MLVFTLIGPPGVGKGTLAGATEPELGLVHVSTGQLIRQEVADDSVLGRRVKTRVEAGEFVDDETVTELVRQQLESLDSTKRGILLDGYPRTLRQAQLLDRMLATADDSLDQAVSLEAPQSVLLERLTGRRVCEDCRLTYHTTFQPPAVTGRCDRCHAPLTQRADDAPETVSERLAIYHERTEPILDFYRNHGVLTALDATGSPEVCAAALNAQLRSLCTP